jgi:hypothetical protein
MKDNLRNALILEVQAISHASRDSNNFLARHLPIEKLVDLKDEKEIIKGVGSKNIYVANNANTYKILGSIAGASTGIKAGLETGDIIMEPEEPTALMNAIGGTLGFLGGGYIGSKLGKDYGTALSSKTYDTIHKK